MTNTARESAQATAPLMPAPDAAVSVDGVPLYGGYEGIVASAALSGLAGANRFGSADPLSILNRRVRQKAWVYVFAATPEISMAAALVDGALTGTGFLMVTDLRTGEVIVDSSRKFAVAAVNDAPGDGLRATYRLPGTRYSVERDGQQTRVRVSLGRSVVSLPGRSQPWVELDLTLQEEGTGTTAIVEVELGRRSGVSVTSKTSGMPTSGRLVVRDESGESRELSLDGGFGGYDYTKGQLPRNTAWRWAYGTGRLPDGTILGINLSEGFSGVGERGRENAVWINGTPSAVDARTRFDYDRGDPMQPWLLSTLDGTVRLRFEPLAAHDERLDLKVLRSLFIQPVGHFSGEIDVAGKTYVLDRLPGVVEDQDIVW